MTAALTPNSVAKMKCQGPLPLEVPDAGAPAPTTSVPIHTARSIS
jgi:hypothetical protein